MAELMRTYDGMGIYATRTDCDKNGAKLTLGINGNVDVLLDENNEPVLDEHGDEIISNNSTAMVSSIGGIPLMASSAAIPYVIKTAGATVTMDNNSFNKIEDRRQHRFDTRGYLERPIHSVQQGRREHTGGIQDLPDILSEQLLDDGCVRGSCIGGWHGCFLASYLQGHRRIYPEVD